MRKKIQPICNNCKLFNPKESCCSVIILHEGEKIQLPVDPEDSCFFEQQYFDPTTKAMEDFNEIQQVKIWVEDEEGNRCENGTVKIEVPKNYL